jgi:hypothetical protein
LACARDGLGREDFGFPDRSSTEAGVMGVMGVMGLTVPNKSSRKLTNVTQPNWTSTWPPPPRFSPLMECHQTIISPPLGPVQEQPKFPSTKKALYDRSFPRTSPIRKKRQSRLYIKLEVFDHTNYSSKADSWGSHNNSGSEDSSPTGFVVRTKQTRPLVFWCSANRRQSRYEPRTKATVPPVAALLRT